MKPNIEQRYEARPVALPERWVPASVSEANHHYASLAVALKSEGRFDEARAAFEKAIELAPEQTDYYCGLAMVQRELRLSREAADTLRHALDKDPGHSQARQLLAEVYLEMGMYTGVIEEARTLLRGSPANAPALAVLAIACQETGELKEALVTVERLVRICPNEAHNHFVLGTLYRQRGEPDRALEQFQRVTELAPESDLAYMAQSEIQSLDGTQIQMILLLAAENPSFRVKLERDPAGATYEYGFRLSDNAISILYSLDFEQIPRRPQHWGLPTHH